MGYISANKMRADVAVAIAAGSIASLLFGTQEVAAWLSPISASDDVSEMGVLNESDLEAVVKLGDLTTTPHIRDTVLVKESPTSQTVKYFVERTVRDEAALHLYLKRA